MGNKIDKISSYPREYSHFRESIRFPDTIPSYRLESYFESLWDWNLFWELGDIEQWFSHMRDNCPMVVTDIPLKEVKNWVIDPVTGNIHHSSGEFFQIHGIRTSIINREVENGWDQPILTQVGYDGGLLGILRKRFSGIPHYLVEAKLEPGNYGGYQLSPTLQATFSNLKRAHKGKKPLFAEYFEDPSSQGGEVLYDAWLSEDGGRLHKKRNRGMLVEIPEDHPIEVDSNRFRWLSLFQIKTLLHKDGWVNPHIRGIIAHL